MWIDEAIEREPVLPPSCSCASPSTAYNILTLSLLLSEDMADLWLHLLLLVAEEGDCTNSSMTSPWEGVVRESPIIDKEDGCRWVEAP